MKRMGQALCGLLLVLVLFVPVAAGSSLDVAVVQASEALPGDVISFDIIVTNLAPVFLDHCNFYFSVGPYVDLIRIWDWIDESQHVSNFFSSLDLPPQYGTSHYFTMPILGKIRDDAPPGSIIESSFRMDTIADVGPDGEWCGGCWVDSAGAVNSTMIDSSPQPVPEFPGLVVPGVFLVVFGVLVSVTHKRD
jgi:hypothetical protein